MSSIKIEKKRKRLKEWKLLKLMRCLSAVCLVCAASVAEAGHWHRSAITHVYPLADGAFILRLESDHQHCSSVENPDYYRVNVGYNGVTAEGSAKLYSLVLLAAASGKEVNLNFSDSPSGCYINRIQVQF